MDPIESSFIDSTHCLTASGGVAQYHVNEYVRIIQDHGLSLEQLDTFKNEITWPAGERKHALTKPFCQDRWNPRYGKHFKAFASEMLSCVTVLVAFTQQVLIPAGILGPHVECFLLLASIMDIYNMGDNAVNHVRELDSQSQTYVEMFDALYPWLAIPKLHMLLHIPKIILRKG